MNRIHCLLALWVLVLIGARDLRAQPAYEIMHLGVPEGAIEVRAKAINSHGHVAGHTVDPGNEARPFVWIDGEMTILPVPDGFPGATPNGIAENGVVSGNTWSNGTFGTANAIMWPSKEEPATFLPTLGGPNAGSMGISPDGKIIVGWSYFSMQSQSSFRPFRYMVNTGVIEDLGLPPEVRIMGGDAKAINAQHQIVVLFLGTPTRSALEDPVEGKIDIGNLGGTQTRATSISNAGHIAGYAETGEFDDDVSGGVIQHAFLWNQGRMIDLGTLEGEKLSRALGVNSSGTVVGESSNFLPISQPRRAFVWQDGEIMDLNDLIPPDLGWELQRAEAINDAGQIVGWGLLDGERRAFLLTPVQ